MSWFNLLWKRTTPGRSPSKRRVIPTLEVLEDRAVPATADLIAYRPDTTNFAYVNFKVAENQEDSHTLGAGIRFNGDDDNGVPGADFANTALTAERDKDLVRVDVVVTGASKLTYTPNLKVWTSDTKQLAIGSGAAVSSGPVWVEYISSTHTVDASSAVLTLSASDGAGSASDVLVFHSFQSIVVAIGGNGQDPATLTGSVFTIAYTLYQQGYDVHTFRHNQVSNSGTGAAYNEVVTAISKRNVDYVAIFGFSYGGAATHDLAKGLSTTSSIQGQYTLRYTAYIDGISRTDFIFLFIPAAERRLPPTTQFHDNIYQRRDWPLKGNSVTGANNLNVTNTTWGSNLVHTTIDDSTMVHSIIVGNLTSRVAR